MIQKIIGPYTQNKEKKVIGDRIKLYKGFYFVAILSFTTITTLFIYGNAKLNYIQEDYYVYKGQKYKLTPEFKEDIPPFEEFVVDTIISVDTFVSSIVDLRKYFSYIKNQGGQGSCLAFSLSGIIEYFMLTERSQNIDFSEAFLYYEARKKAGYENVDVGSGIGDALVCMQEFGICQERFMPYNEYDYKSTPTQAAYNNALSYRIKDAYVVNQQLDILQNILKAGYPIVISAAMFPSFTSGQNDGIIPMPPQNERILYSGYAARYHAMVIVGYDNEKEVFIIRNSWGDDFGDGGYCYMSYDYVTDPDLIRTCIVILLQSLSNNA